MPDMYISAIEHRRHLEDQDSCASLLVDGLAGSLRRRDSSVTRTGISYLSGAMLVNEAILRLSRSGSLFGTEPSFLSLGTDRLLYSLLSPL